jgi:CrcB protein
MRDFLTIGLGAWLGAYSRYWLGTVIAQRWGTAFPWGTALINVTGCLLLGFFGTWALARPVPLATEWRLLIAVGFLGAYTTFSTFGFETLTLMRSGQLPSAALYVLGSVGCGLVAVWAGAVGAGWLVRPPAA